MPTSPLYDGPDRRKTVQDRFEEAVEQASTRAAQKVSGIQYGRTVRATFLATFFASLTIMVFVWFAILKPQEEDFSKKNSIYDCVLFQNTASYIGDFVQKDVKLRKYTAKQNPVTAKLINDLKKVIPVKDLNASVSASNAQINQTIKAWQSDANKIKNLVSTADCIKKLGG